MNDPNTFLEPLAGYLLDVISKVSGRPFVPHSLTKLHNLKICRDLANAKMAVEVGSFKGVTTRRLSYLFDKVISIEIDPALHEKAKKFCSDRTNVEILLGDGTVLLPQIMVDAKDSLLFLDGHYSGKQTGQGDAPEPVLKEVDVLKSYLDKVSAVVVDDFRLFGVEPGWPRKSEVLRKIEDTFPELTWSIIVQYDQFLITRRSMS